MEEKDFIHVPAVGSEHYDADPLHVNAWVGARNSPTCVSSTLLDTGCTVSALIHERLVEQLCERYGVLPFALPHKKSLKGFDGYSAPPVSHAVVLPVQIGDHYQPSMTLLIANIGSHDIIVGKPWMHQHQVQARFKDDGS